MALTRIPSLAGPDYKASPPHRIPQSGANAPVARFESPSSCSSPSFVPTDMDDRLAIPSAGFRLMPPVVRSDWIQRRRLWERLDGTPDTRLILIEAPGGYGKTSLVAQWLIQRQTRSVWLTLSQAESHPRALLNALETAVDRQLDDAAQSSSTPWRELIGDTVPDGIDRLLERLSRVHHELVIVLDDYQAASQPATDALITTLIEYLPALHRMVIVARGSSQIPLARLRSMGLVVDVGIADMALEPSQAEELLLNSGTEFASARELHRIVDRCEGWVAGLNLLSRQPRPDTTPNPVSGVTGSPGDTYDYFSEGVFTSLDPQLRSFLSRTSILDRFTAELCEQVTQRSGAHDAIARSKTAGAYLFGPDQEGWYRYHPLFADFLRSDLRVRCSQEEVRGSHRIAALWYEANGFGESAALHALRAHDWERATTLVREIARDQWNRGNVRSAHQWVERLPASLVSADAELSFWASAGHAHAGQIAEAHVALDRAETLWRERKSDDHLGSVCTMRAIHALAREDGEALETAARSALELPLGEFEHQQATVLIGASLTRQGRPDEAERALANAHAFGTNHGPGWRGIEELEFAWMMLARGRLSEASTALLHLANQTGEPGLDAAIRAHLGIARIELERELLPSARSHLERADELIRELGSSRNSALLDLLRSDLSFIDGDHERALAWAESAQTRSIELGSDQLFRQARAMEARIRIDRDEVAWFQRWAAGSGLAESLPSDFSRSSELFTFLQGMVTHGHGVAALLAAERAENAADRAGLEWTAMAFRSLRALVLFSECQHQQAADLLRPVLHWSERERAVRTVAGYGIRVVPLLRYASSCAETDAYGSYLAALADRSSNARPGTSDSNSHLTPRELEVLRLVSTGMSNRIIGDRLFISEGTVKKHLASILTKLRAENRTEAVAIARHVGVI